MTRDDLRRLSAMDMDFESIGLLEPGEVQTPYFCTPLNAEYLARIGCDGIHFVLLPGDEKVYCVDPAMGEIGTYVLPVAENMREFLSFVLYCKDSSPISQICWMSEERFSAFLNEPQEDWPGSDVFYARRSEALEAIAREFQISPEVPYRKVKALQADFDPSILEFSDEYYDVLGLERP